MEFRGLFGDNRGYKSIGPVVALVVIFLAAPPTFGQLTSGTILGTIRDSSGAVVAGATVMVRNIDTNQTRTSPTEVDGSYRFPALPAGNYEIQASHEGFETVKQSGITLFVAAQVVENVILQVGATTQTVEITAEAPLVNTTSGTLGALVDEQKIADLPLNGRNYIELSLMQPGITRQGINTAGTAGSTGIWYSSNGAPVRSNSYLLDGASMANETGTSPSSVASTSLGIDGIKEYKIVTNASSAEYGMTMGSAMTIVTKSGTNQFHGDGFEYFRNSALDAANFFDPTSTLFPGKRIAPLRRNQFGGSFGGPIKKDKTFFFATYEDFIQSQGAPVIASDFAANCFSPATHQLLTTGNLCATSTAAGAPPKGTVATVVQPFLQFFPYPNLASATPGQPNNRFTFLFTQPTAEEYGQMRIDHNFSSADSLFVRYTGDNATTRPPAALPITVTDFRSRNQYLTLSENHIFSPNLLNNARFSFSRTWISALASNPGFPNCPYTDGPCVSNNSVPGTSLVCSTAYGPVNPGNPPTGNGCLQMGAMSVSGVASFGPLTAAPDIRPQDIFSWSDDVFYTRGKHALKFGTLINHYRMENIEHFGQVGSVSFTSVPNFFAGMANSFNLTDPAHSNDTKYWRWNTLGFYAQDDIRLTGRFTINLGLRYEFTTTVSEAHGNSSALLHPSTTDTANSYVIGQPFVNPTHLNFSPRLGFAWDIFGDGKTSLRGGAAELFDISVYGSALQQAAVGTPPFDEAATVTAPGGTTQQFPLTLPLVVPAVYTPTLRLVDYYLKQPKIFEYNLGLERQLPGRIALTIAYAGSRGIHLFQLADGNPKAPEPGSLTTWPIAGNSLFCVTTATNSCHMNPNLGSINFYQAKGDSYYNSLQVGVIKQLSHRVEFQSSYTYSQVLDDGQAQTPTDDTGSYSPFGPSPFDERLDKGPAAFDARNNWRFNLLYGLPQFSQGKFLGKIVNGWSVSTIESFTTGFPFNPTISGGSNPNPSGNGVNTTGVDRPSWNPAFTGNLYPHTVGEWFDPAAFILPVPGTSATGPVGTLGNVGRGALRGPILSNTDFSLRKDTSVRALGEAGSIQFRLEVFNIFNHPNFSLPSSTAAFNGTSATASATAPGQITATNPASDSRRIQLAMKILF